MAHELAHTQQQKQTSPTLQRAEIDDRPQGCANLQDSGAILDSHVNRILQGAAGTTDGLARVESVYDQLGRGLPYSAIEDWCLQLPQTHQNHLTPSQTYYANNFYGRQGGTGWVNPWILKPRGVLGTLLNMGGQCIGSDKLGHFFQQGRDYFTISVAQGHGDVYAEGFGRWLEGQPPTDPAIQAWLDQMGQDGWPGFDRLNLNATFYRGVFGLSTTGVFSPADLTANRAGMEFYKRVHASPATRFSHQAYINGQWNEQVNPSCYSESMARLRAANDPQFTAAYRAAIRAAVNANPYAISAYHGQGIFLSMVEPYVERYRCR